MMENMIGELARTIQSDRRAASARNERIVAASIGQATITGRLRGCRAAIAKALVALAIRLAPDATDATARPTVTAGGAQ